MKKLAAALIASLFTTVAFAQASAPAPSAPAAAAPAASAPAHKPTSHMKKASHHTMHKKAAETVPAAASAAQ